MRPVLPVMILAAVHAGPAQTSETFGGNIVLARPTDRSITLNGLRTADHDSVHLEYGDGSAALDKQTPLRQSIQATAPCQEVIGGREPNRRYYFRVRYRKAAQYPYVASAEHSFRTHRPQGSTYIFSVVPGSLLFSQKHCFPKTAEGSGEAGVVAAVAYKSANVVTVNLK